MSNFFLFKKGNGAKTPALLFILSAFLFSILLIPFSSAITIGHDPVKGVIINPFAIAGGDIYINITNNITIYNGTSYNVSYNNHMNNLTMHNDTFWYNHTLDIINLYGQWFYNMSDGSYNATYAGGIPYWYNYSLYAPWNLSNDGTEIFQNNLSAHVGIGTNNPDDSDLFVQSNDDDNTYVSIGSGAANGNATIIFREIATVRWWEYVNNKINTFNIWNANYDTDFFSIFQKSGDSVGLVSIFSNLTVGNNAWAPNLCYANGSNCNLTSSSTYNASYNAYNTSAGLSGYYVPYTGAIADVDLGANNLTTTGFGQFQWQDILENASLIESPPNSTLRLYVENFKNFSVYKFIDSRGMKRELVRDSIFIVKRVAAANVSIMSAVYACTSTGDGVPVICFAKANDMATMPAVGLTIENITSGNYGRVMQVGLLENVDTSAWATGDILYVSATTFGGLTNVKPSVPALSQEIGTVLVSSATVGKIQVLVKSVTGNEYGTINNFTVQGNLSATGTYHSFLGNLNISKGNVTADWFFGKLNWSDVQNSPLSGSVFNATYDSHLRNMTAHNESTASDYNWQLHQDYPPVCYAGNFVTEIGDTLTCEPEADPIFVDNNASIWNVLDDWTASKTSYLKYWYNHTSSIETLYGKWFYNMTVTQTTYNATYAAYNTSEGMATYYGSSTHTHDAANITAGTLAWARLPSFINATTLSILNITNINLLADTHTHAISNLTGTTSYQAKAGTYLTNITITNGVLSGINSSVSASVSPNSTTLAWSNITNEPTACSAGQYATALPSTNDAQLTCSTPAGGAPTLYSLQANRVQTSASFNVTLFNFTLSANTNYTLHCALNEYTATAAQGFQINITTPASPTYVFYNFDTFTATPGFFNCAGAVNSCSYIGTAAIASPGTPVHIDGRIWNINVGTLQLLIKTETAGTAQTFTKGSYCELEINGGA